MKSLLLPVLLLYSTWIWAQDDLAALAEELVPKESEPVLATFKAFRLINAQTNETAKERNLHFNIAHRFGTVFTDGQLNVHSFFGLDQAPDIRFSFDYGVTDRLQLGVGRSKGLEPYTELYDGNAKYRLLWQTTDDRIPVSITLYGVAAVTGRKSSSDPSSDAYYQDRFAHRWSYVSQAIIARKFSPGASLMLLPTWTHRNYVYYKDENDMFSLGIGGRIKVSNRTALIADYFYNFSEYRRQEKDDAGDLIFSNPLSLGVEFETGGHVFALMFTNAAGILENSFLPATKSSWADGEFRWGFNLTRNFVLGRKDW
ncbi:MAG: DUF5777 family beta-barrel protein [Chitinophagales bacterium]|nr:DUF5777 family beta-barrel protein [Chitinophagales bacterium]MDW8394100.1 DUF5777 family beta-barrel protein [Chitinophagales bacterium]